MNKRILVVGDVIIDESTIGSPLGLSAETPTIVLEQVSTNRQIGGAGLVARNIVNLFEYGRGGEVGLLTIRSPDEGLASEKSLTGVTDFSLPVKGFNFTRKKRFFSGLYKLLQVDVLNKGRHTSETENSFLDEFDRLLDRFDEVVVCDNRHGAISHNVARGIVLKCWATGKRLYVDSQVSQNPSNHMWYKGCDTMFMNERELFAFHDVPRGEFLSPPAEPELLEQASVYLSSDIILKKGERGCSRFDWREDTFVSVPGEKANVVDTCGAGDCFMAAYVVTNDLVFANRYAAASVELPGTGIPNMQRFEENR